MPTAVSADRYAYSAILVQVLLSCEDVLRAGRRSGCDARMLRVELKELK